MPDIAIPGPGLLSEAPVLPMDIKRNISRHRAITLNAYIPMAKYEIVKDIPEEEIQRICGQIAADLTALLQRNPRLAARYHNVHPLGRKMLFRGNGVLADGFAHRSSEKVGQYEDCRLLDGCRR